MYSIIAKMSYLSRLILKLEYNLGRLIRTKNFFDVPISVSPPFTTPSISEATIENVGFESSPELLKQMPTHTLNPIVFILYLLRYLQLKVQSLLICALCCFI
ncbi:hypothetical protein A9Q96_10150 [Rhodobacterales bacterium 52_120_T64]|nr:hypothetical protein A9Q96_10150 [Rhodobacterales bacterium 52_120_T64]